MNFLITIGSVVILTTSGIRQRFGAKEHNGEARLIGGFPVDEELFFEEEEVSRSQYCHKNNNGNDDDDDEKEDFGNMKKSLIL